LTVAEIVYVLERVYRWPRRDVADRLLNLLDAEVFAFADRAAIRRALGWYGSRASLDLPDAYLAGLVVEGAHDAIATFDEGIGRATGAAVVEAPDDLAKL
jgi:predicted nucleic-acid-binding protein